MSALKNFFRFKFDEDGNGTIEFAEFLVMMATKAKEAEIEEAENFIPCCFRVMRDKKGKTLKVHFYSSHCLFKAKSTIRQMRDKPFFRDLFQWIYIKVVFSGI